MDDHTAVALAEGFDLRGNPKRVIAAWQHLHDTGLAYRLQGWFGRTATRLIQNGTIQEGSEDNDSKT